MWIRLKVLTVTSLVAAMVVTTTACGNDNVTRNSAQSTASPIPTAQQGGANTGTSRSLAQEGQGMRLLSTEDAVIPLKTIGNVKYVPLQEMANVLNFQTDWDAQSQKMLIGDNDANFEINMNSTKANKEGNEIQVSQPFVMEGGTAYIPVSALGDLFQEDMSYELKDNQLNIHPSSIVTIEHEDDPGVRGDDPELSFVEDPSDPFKAADETENQASANLPRISELEAWNPTEADEDDAVPVLKNINVNAMIGKGKQYLGVRYKFGAKPYPQSGRFDCSTFTQYVYGKYGVHLPRLARQQAAKGTLVSRKSLRRGDLMFFYVPGRFKTNKTVGHVGIYIGNMKMLHASPDPKNGVQITNINKAYWKETFLRAKRIVY